MKKTRQNQETRVELPRFTCNLLPITCNLSPLTRIIYPIFCILSSVLLFGDTWQQTSISDFNTAGSATVQTEVFNDTVQLAGQSDWWKPAENWWDTNFQYRKAITVNNSGASPLSDYQVKVENPVYNETGLVGSWHFEETAGTTTGTIMDTSGQGNNGTMNNFAGPNGVTVNGKFANAVSFDGTNDYITIPDANNLDLINNLSIESWVNPVTLNPGGTILTKSAYSYYTEVHSDGKVRVYLNGCSPAGYHNSNISISTGIWSHIAWTYDGNNVRIYINGALDKTVAVTGNLTQTNGEIRIGSLSGLSPGYDFNGSIDEVRIYNRTLGADEIQSHYNAKAKLNYGDIRFTGNSGTEFPYWMEKDGTFWVKVEGADSIPVGLSSIFMYYGNASAVSASSGTNTFEFFDEFATDLWTDVGTLIYVDTSNQRLYMKGDRSSTDNRSYFDKTSISDDNWEMNFILCITGSSGGNGLIDLGCFSNSENRYGGTGDAIFVTFGNTTIYPSRCMDNGSVIADPPSSITILQNTKYFVTLERTSATQIKTSVFSDSARIQHVTGSPVINSIPSTVIGLRYFQAGNYKDGIGADFVEGWADTIYSTQFVFTEPVITIGSEITQTSAWLNRQKITVTAADAVASGYSVKANIDLESMRSAGDVQNDLDDLRVVAYDRTGTASYELDRDIIKGQGINLNGSSQYVDLPDGNMNLSTFTSEAWIKPSNTGLNAIFSNYIRPSSEYGFRTMISNGGKLYFQVNGINSTGTTNTVPVDTWTHVAVTYNGATQSANFYINGSFDSSYSYGVSPDYSTTPNAEIGHIVDGSSYYFAGQIDEVRLSNSIRYSSNFTPQQTTFIPDASTVGLWHLDGDARDYSRNSSSNNGTLSGSPYYTEGKVLKSRFEASAVSISASIGNSGTGPIANANDGDWNNIWDAQDAQTYPGVTVTLQYSTAFVATRFATEFTGNNIVTMTLKGSNDGTNWTDIATGINYTGGNTRQDFTFLNSTAYSYYRVLYVTATVNCLSSDVTEVVFYADPKNELWFKTQSAISASSTSESDPNSSSYYMYYDNFLAGSPPEYNDNVYLAYDDFSTNRLGSYWLGDTGSFSISNSILSHTGGAVYHNIYHAINLPSNENWRMYGRVKVDSGNIDAYIGGNDTAGVLRGAGNGIGLRPSGSNIWEWGKWVSGSETSLGSGSYTINTYSDFEISKIGTTFKAYKDSILGDTETVTEFPVSYFQLESYGTGYYDRVLVRKYTANEPTLSLGTEDFPYSDSGTFTSSVKNAGGNDARIDSVSWTAIGTGTLTMEIRADNSDPAGWSDPTPAWEIVTNGDTSVAATGRYLQYRAAFTGNGTSAEPVLTDITVTYTVPIIPPADSVSCDKLTNNWYSTAVFTFTNTVGFGAQIEKYYYAWDNASSYTFTLAEPVWNSLTPQLQNSATTDGLWYFHYKPYSSTNDAGTAQDLGPFKYDGTAPSVTTLSIPLNNASIEESITAFSWEAVTDLSGISYTLQLDNYTSFSSPVINKTNLTDTTYTLSGTGAEILIGNSTYYWRVIVTDGASNTSYMSNPSYYKFTTASTIPQMINESTGEMYASIQDAINSASTTDGDIVSIEDTIAHTESITLSKDVTLQNGILSPAAGFAVTGQGTAGGEILRNCVITSGGVSNLALGENLTIFSPDSSLLVIENSHLVNCLIEFGATITNSTLDNCDLTATSDYFVSASTMDFRLKSTAVSAIDQGINLSAEFSVDKDGNTKGVDVLDITNFDTGAWDIGAYEFSSASYYLTNSGDSGGSGGTGTIAVSIYTTPSALIFYADYDDPGVETASFTVFKDGDTDVNWTVSDDANWLALNTASGSTSAAMEVQVTADSTGLSAGEYTATITITAPDAGNSPVVLPATLLVFSSENGAVLYSAPASLNFSAEYGSSVQSTKSLVIYANGVFGLDWSAQDDVDWLSIVPPLGNTLQSVNMEVIMTPSGLMAGVHTGTITITSAGAVNSPVSVPVTLVITDSTVPGGQDNGNGGQVTGGNSTVVLAKPVQLSPLNGSIDVYPAPVLSWDADPEVTSLLQISLNAEFTDFLVSKLVDIQAYQTAGVKYDTVYYWRVKTIKGNAVSDWSDTWWFRMDTGSEKAAESKGPAGCFLGKILIR